MLSSIRGCAAALVFVWVWFPAMTRAVQVLDSGNHAPQTSGFHKSVDVPPNAPVVAPDPTAPSILIEAPARSFDRWLRTGDDRLPSAQSVPTPPSLRAPPSGR